MQPSRPKCAACEHGPAGIDGHATLYSHTMTGKQMGFLCRDCGCAWTRRYAARGGFAWSEPSASEHPGMDVPGRIRTLP